MRAIPVAKLEKLEEVSEIFRSRYSTPAQLARAEKKLHVLFPRLKNMSDQAVVAFIARAREVYHDKLVRQTQIGGENVHSLDMRKMFGSRLTAANFGHVAASPRRASPPKRSAVRGSMF